MLNQTSKAVYRDELFRHLDGLVMAPVAHCLFENKVTDYLLQKEQIALQELVEKFNANAGYLNVAVRVLASQGWLDYRLENDQVFLSKNEKTEAAFQLIPLYKDVVDLLHFSGKFHKRKFELEPFRKLEKIFQKYTENYNIEKSVAEDSSTLEHQVLKHIDCLYEMSSLKNQSNM